MGRYRMTQKLEFTGYCTLLAVEMIMSYQVKTEDLTKLLSNFDG